MEKRNVIEEGRTPGFVKTATTVDEFEKRARSAFSGFKPRKPVPEKKPQPETASK